MVDFATQRINMVESQVRPSDVTDRRITRAMRSIPREEFVPASLKSIAYMDDALRVADTGNGHRQLLPPRTLAKLVQLLDIDSDHLVLEVGCATGYTTAVLAHLCQTVIGLEVDPMLAERAQRTLAAQAIDNAVVVIGPLAAGVAAEGPYDAILVSGAVCEAPVPLLDQLKDGGRLVAVKYSGAVGRATVWRRIGQSFDERASFDAAAAYLPGFAPVAGFTF